VIDMTKFLLTLAACACAASAQTKIAGKGKCNPKPDAQQAIEVGDRANHNLVIVKQSCVWTEPMEMAGLKTKSYYAVVSSDAMGDKGADRGYVIVTMENGDKAFVKFQGSSMSKNGAPDTDEGTWSYTGGTGKLKGLKGKGTYKGKMVAADNFEDTIEGEYSLPAATAKK